MGRNSKEISRDIRQVIVDMKLEGHKTCAVQSVLKIPESTIRSVWKKYQLTGKIENVKREGRPSKLTQRDKNWIVRHTKANRGSVLNYITNDFNETRNANDSVNPRTIQRFLHKNDFKRRVVRQKMVVSEVNRKRRVAWCKDKRNLSVNNYWNSVIFSDESQVVIGESQRVYVWRTSRESYLPQCMCPPRERRISVMVWGCITYHGVGTLCMVNGNINAQKYISIWDDNLLPVVARHFNDKPYRFQDDNAPVHRARSTKNYIQQNSIPTTRWPAQSPDINIIENLWLRIKRSLQNRAANVRTPEELFAAITDIWTSFEPDYIKTLYNSITRRITAVIKSKGHLTKY